MADLRLEMTNEGFYIEPLTEEGLQIVNIEGELPHYQIGDHVDYPLLMQDMFVHLAKDRGLVIVS